MSSMKKLHDIGVEISEFLRRVKRGMQGLPIEENKYQWLLDVDDIRERTDLAEHDVYGHSLMKIGADLYEELGIWGKIADMEDHYFISEEGEGKKLAATIQIGKKEQTTTGVAIQLPTIQTQPPIETKPTGKEGKK